MKIYVKEFGRKNSVEKFITELFTYGIPPKGTVFKIQVPTYLDPKCTKLQIEKNRYRSFRDMLYLVQTYYPSYTAKKLINVLANMRIRNTHLFHPIDCNSTKLTTCCFTVHGQNHLSNTNLSNSEFKNWKQIYSLIGITNTKKFLEHKKNLLKNE